jgi:hypothetical protein
MAAQPTGGVAQPGKWQNYQSSETFSEDRLILLVSGQLVLKVNIELFTSYVRQDHQMQLPNVTLAVTGAVTGG